MVVVSVLYPLPEGTSFDMVYYLGSHVPLCQELLGPMGLRETRVYQGSAGSAFHVVADLYFDTQESMDAALAAHGPRTQADIPNFTNTTPVIQTGRVLV